ncbi:hypothetical protein SBADM41S_04051 [Streptomyces badius]
MPRAVLLVLEYNPAALFINLMRYALIDSYTWEQLPHLAWAAAAGWALLCGVGFMLEGRGDLRTWLTARNTPGDHRVPTVVVDDVHITYTVNGARTGRGGATWRSAASPRAAALPAHARCTR